jgi:hypothetical protein
MLRTVSFSARFRLNKQSRELSLLRDDNLRTVLLYG